MDDGQRLSFGPFQADLREQRLWRADAIVPVTRKSFALLAVLLGRPGRLVTKNEIFASVWRGASVSDAALSRCIRELRVALGDDAASPRYIETAHGLGFRFVAALNHGAAAAADHPPPLLVGRTAELDELRAAFAAAHGGRRQLVFVTGEPGIGKTTLIETFIATGPGLTVSRDADRGWIAQGRCIEHYGTGEAYLPVLEALERLARQAGPERLRAVLERYAPAWLELLPWLARAADRTATPRSAAGTTSQRMVREIAQALEVLAEERPIVLWLEDLHWSDYSSLEVVAFLAGRGDPARLLVIGTYRPAEVVARDTLLRRLKPELQLHGRCREIALGYLGEDAVGRYLAARLTEARADALDALARVVHRRTEGNALFMVALVEDLLRRGRLQPAARGRDLRDLLADVGATLPDNLRQLIDREFERLSEAEQRLLEAAAVAGDTFSAAAVAAAHDVGLGLAQVERACGDLVRRGAFLRRGDAIAWPDGTVAGGFGFRHALYRQALYDRVPTSRRIAIHRRIAERLEAAHGDQAADVAAELAMHFEAARDLPRGLRHLERAGMNALQRHAYREGIDLFRHGLTLLGALPDADRDRQELALRLPLGAALIAAQGYGTRDVETSYRRARELCRSTGDEAALTRVLKGLWNVSLIRSELATAQALAEELLSHARAGSDATRVFDAYAKLGQTAMHRGAFDAARRHLEHALDLARRMDGAGRLQEAPRVAAYLAWVLWYQGFPDPARAYGRAALALARSVGNPHSTAFALGFVGWLHQLLGETDSTARLAEQQHALSAEHDLPYWRLWSSFLLGLCATRRGGGADGIARMREALDAYRRTGAEAGVAFFLAHLADACRRAGQAQAALAALDEATILVARNDNRYHEAELHRLRGVILGERGGLDDAARCLERAVAVASGQGARGLELRALTDLVRLRPPQDRGAAATRLAACLAGFAESGDTADLAAARAALDATDNRTD